MHVKWDNEKGIPYIFRKDAAMYIGRFITEDYPTIIALKLLAIIVLNFSIDWSR